MTSTSQPLEHVGAGVDGLGKTVFVTVGPSSREVSTLVWIGPETVETIVVGTREGVVIVKVWPEAVVVKVTFCSIVVVRVTRLSTVCVLKIVSSLTTVVGTVSSVVLMTKSVSALRKVWGMSVRPKSVRVRNH